MSNRIPADKQTIFDEISTQMKEFGADHLDPELTGFVMTLWARVCRSSKFDPRRGQRGVWGAAVIHVIARMNFCYDRTQPVHITLDTLCNHFGARKPTVGGKAAEIEKTLRLSHCDRDICRSEFTEMFGTVMLDNGIILPVFTAKKMGLLPPDA